jgi:tetratricopeptide (TPR) repeat protein
VASSRALKRLVDALRSGADTLDNGLADPIDRVLLKSRLHNFVEFASSYAPACRDALYWRATVPLEPLPVGIVGLNTVLLSQDDADRGVLALGKEQLVNALRPGSAREVVFVLSHHPFEWLRDGDEVSSWVDAHAHVHLVGHTHLGRNDRVYRGTGSTCIHINSGATHAAGQEGSHGYSIGALYLTPERSMVRVWPRIWSPSAAQFRVDVHSVPDRTEYADHELSISVPAPISIQAPKDSRGSDRSTAHDDTSTQRPPQGGDVPESDLPLLVDAWVGRNDESKALALAGTKVAWITGMGGQGKSALAGYYLASAAGEYELWDWRDCREEGDKLHTQLVNILARVSAGRIRPSDVANESFESLVRSLFGALGSRRVLFVFDNVDQYIDLEEQKPVGGLRVLTEWALRANHRSRFIFTSRPQVKYEDGAFLRLPLRGFTDSETIDLFRARGVDTESPETLTLIRLAQNLTRGHPLWLNLVATQVSRNRAELADLVADIQRARPAELPTSLLRSIWSTLNPKQIYVLRCLAETVRPETEERLEEIVAPRMSRHQLTRHLRALKLLDLVVRKASDYGSDTLELHPLIRQFVRSEYPTAERELVIDLIIVYYDRAIAKFKTLLASDAPFSVLEHWTHRAELALNAGRLAESIAPLREVGIRMCNQGYPEEFLRIALRVLMSIDWASDADEGVGDADMVLFLAAYALADLGRHADADAVLDRYELGIAGKSAKYINLAQMRAYAYWCRGDMNRAKQWGERGSRLKADSQIDTKFQPEYTLALARRDSGEVPLALDHFLRGEELASVLASGELRQDGPFYGNIGRCLQLMTRFTDALVCYRKSARILGRPGGSPVNLGFAYLWIAETSEALQRSEIAYCFFVRAARLWEAVSPPRAEKASAAANAIKSKLPSTSPVLTFADWQVEAQCAEWLNAEPASSGGTS